MIAKYKVYGAKRAKPGTLTLTPNITLRQRERKHLDPHGGPLEADSNNNNRFKETDQQSGSSATTQQSFNAAATRPETRSLDACGTINVH